tara:strand:- start:147 stop:707 length:561 start_codon:yes stop_codon:yes gene_type:complete
MSQDEEIRFEEGQSCPVKIQGGGGGLSFSPNGDMLLIGAIPNPTVDQTNKWSQKWRAKLVDESEFPSIPIFAIGDAEDWFLETPCNPGAIEREAPGFCEALFAKDEYQMVAVLVDSNTNIINKIHHVELDDLFVERLVLAWNPYRYSTTPGAPAEYSRAFTDQEFGERIHKIFKMKTSEELWRTSW